MIHASSSNIERHIYNIIVYLFLYLNVRLKNQFWLIYMTAFEVAHLAASPASPPSQVFMNKAHHSEQREANKFQDLSTEQRKNQKHTLCKYAYNMSR